MANIFSEIWEMEDLRKRVLFTLGMLGVFRMGVFVPAPGIDRHALGEWFQQQGNTLFGLYNMFSGGALEQFSVFVLGIMPYITASIIIQLLAEMEPSLKRKKEEGQAGRAALNQYTRYLTIGIAVAQSLMIAIGLEQMTVMNGQLVVPTPGWSFRLLVALTMTAGSCFVMWLGERISEHGIGNGSSIIISAGILARMPSSAWQMWTLMQEGQTSPLMLGMLLAFMFLVIFLIVYVERGQRRVPLRHARRVMGANIYEGETTYLPLKLNNAGVIPPIFASSLLMLPSTFTQFWDTPTIRWISNAFYPGAWLYNASYVLMIVFFAFFYTAMQFRPEDVADNLKKQGGFIPKVRPGRETAAYLDWLLIRLTAAGAVYLSALCVLPTVLAQDFGVPFYFGGTSVLILVGVTLDTVGQIQAKLSTKHYSTLSGPQPEGDRVKNRRRRLGGQGPFV